MTKYQVNKIETRNRNLLLIALIMGVGVGGVGSYCIVKIGTGNEWIVIALIALTLLEGYVIGRIASAKKANK